MKYLIVIGLIIFGCFACDNEEFDNKPSWMDEKVDAVLSEKDDCEITTVTVYQYNDELYYNIYCGYWSCMFCHLYNADGEKVDLSQEDFNDFNDLKEKLEEFPACE